MKRIAGNLKPLSCAFSRQVRNILFRACNHFRQENGGRTEVRIDGRTAIYDVFPCRDNRYIALVGYYGRLDHPENLVCTFDAEERAECTPVVDSPHEHEGEQVLVCLFPVPERARLKGNTSVTLATGENRTLLSGLGVDLPRRQAKHGLSVATIMKDEDRFLQEWIEYYRVAGAGHFYIYDNSSLKRGKIRKILTPYIEQGIVTLVDWDYPYAIDKKNTWRFCQRGHMHHCLYKYGHLSDWMLFIDVDEYVYPLASGQTSLLPLLQHHEQDPAIAALQFSMVWFGNSGLKKVPEGLVIENYTRRADSVIREGREKCCVRPGKVELLFIHDVKRCVEGTDKLRVPADEYRINHYYATSWSRRKHCDDQFNDQEDAGMRKFVPLVRRRLGTTS